MHSRDGVKMSHKVTLTFNLLTSKSNQFIFVPDCTALVNLLKFQQAVYIVLTSF